MNRKALVFFLAFAYALPSSAFVPDSLGKTCCANGWKVEFMTGYGFSAAGDILGMISTTDGQNMHTSAVVRGTHGQGLLSTIRVDYRLVKRLHVDVGYFENYGLEKMINSTSSEIDPAMFSKQTIRVQSNGMFAGLGLEDSIGNFRLSVATDFACGFNHTAYQRTSYNYPGESNYSEWKHTGGLSFGWLSSFSCSYAINDKFAVGIQGFVMLHSWTPRKGELIAKVHNGQDELYTVPKEDRSVEFRDDIYYSPFSGFPQGFSLPFCYPLSIAGCGVSASYRF